MVSLLACGYTVFVNNRDQRNGGGGAEFGVCTCILLEKAEHLFPSLTHCMMFKTVCDELFFVFTNLFEFGVNWNLTVVLICCD